MEEKLRTVTFRLPRRKFTLTMWATDQVDSRGQTLIHYRLCSDSEIYFEASDFSGSPLHSDDSDETVKALMNFLTLRNGDVEPDYFKKYTEKQLDFQLQYAEDLAYEVYRRFGE